MVTLSTHYNFASVVDEFITLKPFTGPHAELLRSQLRTRAQEILSHADIRYMPAFKILDLLAEMVNTASAIAQEPQLRPQEATALLHAHMSDTSPLVREFMLEAALERARYAPMMLDATDADGLAYRNLTLEKRWQAMRTAHQSLTQLPDDWIAHVDQHVASAIHAPVFASYRTGPLMQLFAEMLQTARNLHESAAPLHQLAELLDPQSPLWRRYALKAGRYKEPPTAAQPTSLPTQARVPSAPLPTIHSVH